jgi:hypothetical protein
MDNFLWYLLRCILQDTYYLLSQEIGVEAISVSDLINIIPKENSKKNISTKYYLSSTKNRNFLFADFLYNNRYTFIIEIELDKSWQGISTWFFISENTEDFELTEDIIQDIISYYIGECKSYHDLMEYVCIEYNLVMYKKAHVKKPEDESLLYHWVDDVLYNLNCSKLIIISPSDAILDRISLYLINKKFSYSEKINRSHMFVFENITN